MRPNFLLLMQWKQFKQDTKFLIQSTQANSSLYNAYGFYLLVMAAMNTKNS